MRTLHQPTCASITALMKCDCNSIEIPEPRYPGCQHDLSLPLATFVALPAPHKMVTLICWMCGCKYTFPVDWQGLSPPAPAEFKADLKLERAKLWSKMYLLAYQEGVMHETAVMTADNAARALDGRFNA